MADKQNIVLIDYGAGNTKSVLGAIQKLGYKARLSADKDEILAADKLIFPGVGHAKSAWKNLEKNNMVQLLKEVQQPFLGICLGMQLMCSWLEEGDMCGLEIFEEDVFKFPKLKGLKVPHMGWNQIKNLKTPLFKTIEEGSNVYFVHSYYVPISSYTTSVCTYGIEFSASLQKNNFYGMQFHPEKSGNAGLKILSDFLAMA